MRYMLLIYTPDEARSDPAITAEYMAIAELPETIGGAELQAAATATTVRVDSSGSVTTDGPFAESKEVLGGYFLLEADDLARALEAAARVPAARSGGAVEVRPLVER